MADRYKDSSIYVDPNTHQPLPGQVTPASPERRTARGCHLSLSTVGWRVEGCGSREFKMKKRIRPDRVCSWRVDRDARGIWRLPSRSGQCAKLRCGSVDPLKLTYGGVAIFDCNGNFAVLASTKHVINFVNANGNASSQAGASQLPRAHRRSPARICRHWVAQLMRSRAGNCLTIADAAPCISPAVPPTAFNVVSSEVDLSWLIDQELQAAWKDVPIPGIVLQANPPEGLSQMDSWFWVDRRTYDGQRFWEPVHIPVPWTLDWDTLGPPP